jgi:hypothetical protein
MIRQLPPGFALVIRGDCAPVIARLPRAWNNPAYRRARLFGHALPDPLPWLPPAADPDSDLDPDIPDHLPAAWMPDDGTSFPWS